MPRKKIYRPSFSVRVNLSGVNLIVVLDFILVYNFKGSCNGETKKEVIG